MTFNYLWKYFLKWLFLQYTKKDMDIDLGFNNMDMDMDTDIL